MEKNQKEEPDKSLEESVAKGWYCSAAKLARELGRSEGEIEEYEARQKAYSTLRRMLRRKYSWKAIGETLEELADRKVSEQWDILSGEYRGKRSDLWKHYSQLAIKAYMRSAREGCDTKKEGWCKYCEEKAKKLAKETRRRETRLKLEYHEQRKEWAEAAKTAEELGWWSEAIDCYVKIDDIESAKCAIQSWKREYIDQYSDSWGKREKYARLVERLMREKKLADFADQIIKYCTEAGGPESAQRAQPELEKWADELKKAYAAKIKLLEEKAKKQS